MASAAAVAEVAARIIRALYARTGNGKIAELGATEPCQVTLWPRRDSISFFPKWKEEKHEEEVKEEEHQFNLTIIYFIAITIINQPPPQIGTKFLYKQQQQTAQTIHEFIIVFIIQR